MIYVSFDPADSLLVEVVGKTQQYSHASLSGAVLRAIVQHHKIGIIVAAVVGDEAAFNTWRTANPEVVDVIGDPDAFFAVDPEEHKSHWSIWKSLDIHNPNVEWKGSDELPASAKPHTLFEAIPAELKKKRYKDIDNKTRELIAAGFEYPSSSGQFFSLSSEAQIKWIGMFVAKDILSYPVVVRTADEQTDVSLTDAADMTAFYTEMVTTVRSHIDSGRALKGTLRDASAPTEDDVLTTAADER
jgi:hypothetical protein